MITGELIGNSRAKGTGLDDLVQSLGQAGEPPGLFFDLLIGELVGGLLSVLVEAFFERRFLPAATRQGHDQHDDRHQANASQQKD